MGTVTRMGEKALEYVFYIDAFFLAEFFRDLLALWLAASLGRRRCRPLRLCLAAAFGSLWSLLMLFLGLPVPVRFLATGFLAAGIMNGVAFSLRKPEELLRAGGLFLMTSVFLGGGISLLRQSAGLSAWESLLAAGAFCIGPALFFRRLSGKRAVGNERFVVRLYYRGKRKEFRALADSGNRLFEPGSGKPVCVISYGDCVGFCDRLSSVIYIPYRAVGTGCGALPGIRLERMEILKGSEWLRVERPVVAVTREALSGNGDFNMLLPEQLLFGEA